MKIAFANVVLNVALNFALRPVLGVAGIALSTTVTYVILDAIYFGVTLHRWGRGILRGPGAAITGGASALACGGAAAILLATLPAAHSRLDALLVALAVAGGVLVAHGVVLAVGRAA
jgi:putative peptidoglycan lipid II flippase